MFWSGAWLIPNGSNGVQLGNQTTGASLALQRPGHRVGLETALASLYADMAPRTGQTCS